MLDAVESEKAAIVALVDGATMALLFAATHPERTSALVLGNSTARFLEADDYPEGISQDAANPLRDLIGRAWGTEELAVLTSPSLANDERERKWFAKFMRGGAQVHGWLRCSWAVTSRSIYGRSCLPSVFLPSCFIAEIYS